MDEKAEPGHEGCSSRPTCCSGIAAGAGSDEALISWKRPADATNEHRGLHEEIQGIERRIRMALDDSGPLLDPSDRNLLHIRARMAAVAFQMGELADLTSRQCQLTA